MPPVHRILIADPIHEQAQSLLASRPGFEVAVATGLSEAELTGRIGDYDGVIVRSKTRITSAAISAGQRLKVIGRAGIGVDNIDVAAATERGIVVLNTPDANATTTAELALAHLLSLSRHLPQADRSVRAGERQPAKFVGSELAGKSVGVIGFGTIGRIFARRCLALRMQVLAYDPFVTPEVIEQAGAESVTLEVTTLLDSIKGLATAGSSLMSPGKWSSQVCSCMLLSCSVSGGKMAPLFSTISAGNQRQDSLKIVGLLRTGAIAR